MSACQAQSFVDLAYARLIGETGLIHSIQEILVAPGEPRLYNVSSVTANLQQVSDIHIPGAQGAAAFTYDEAAAGAVGETVERYCAACYDWNDLIYSSARELGEDTVGMDRFAMYTDEVYADRANELARWSPEMPIYWAQGKSLHTGARRYVPACLVYLPYRDNDPRRLPKLAMSVSSGQACHTDPDRALLSGLCEAVERDAFMISWLRRIPGTRIHFQNDPYLGSIYRRHFECSSVEFHLFDITLDIRIPTMLCIGAARVANGLRINAGAATRPCEREAAIKAMTECAQGAAWANELVRSKPAWKPEPGFTNVRTFEDHVRLYCDPEMAGNLDFIMRTPHAREFAAQEQGAENPTLALRNCLAELERHGLEAIAVDLTTPEIAELGLCVPKVLVPGLAPLTAVHTMPAMGSPRFGDVPKKLGLADPIHYQVNPAPHPFP